MSSKSKLEALYAAIPTFECKPGCSDCCGPVPFAKAEWEPVKLVTRIAGSCLDCSYSVGGKCSIYEHRPFMCRLFGATTEPKLQCPHGCAPAKPLTGKQAQILTARYAKIIGVSPVSYSVDI